MSLPAPPTIASDAMSEPTSPTSILQVLSDRALPSSTADQDPRPASSSSTFQPVSPSMSAVLTAEDHPSPTSIATGTNAQDQMRSSSPVVPIEEHSTPASPAPTEEDTLAASPLLTADNSSKPASPVHVMEDQPALHCRFSAPQTGETDIVPAIVIPGHANTTMRDGIHDEDITQPISPDATTQHDAFSVPAVSGKAERTKAKHEEVPCPTSSPPASNNEGTEDDSRQPQAQVIAEPTPRTKRKHRATLVEDNEEVGVIEATAPPSKKMKVHKDAEPDEIEPIAKPKKTVLSKKASAKTEPNKNRVAKSIPAPKTGRGTTWYNEDHGKKLDTLARNEQKRLLAAPNTHLTAMHKAPDYVKVTPVAATVEAYQNNIKKAKGQVKYIASALGPGTNRNRDIGGKTNKFDRQDANVALNKDNVSAWKGSKWKDEQNENMTWFKIPAKQKTLSLAGRLVPMAEIIAKSAKFPEFTLMGKEMTENPKTGNKEVGFYTITYEKLEPEQAPARSEALVRRAKAEATQRKKDEAAERRRQARGGDASRKKSRA